MKASFPSTMKKLTYLHLGIFAVVLVNVTAILHFPIIKGLFRSLNEAFSEIVGEGDGAEKINTAIDIYMKSKKINEKIPKEEEDLVESLLQICRRDRTLLDILRRVNKCRPQDLKGSLVLFLEGLNKGRNWIKN